MLRIIISWFINFSQSYTPQPPDLHNDQDHMIAICPTCHDAVHHGPLEITDDTIYSWKSIKRKPTNRDHIL